MLLSRDMTFGYNRSAAVELFSLRTLADRERSERWYDEIFRLTQGHERVTVVEVGVALGGSLALAGRAIADGAQTPNDSELIGFDKFLAPYDYSANDMEGHDFETRLTSEMNLMTRRGIPMESSIEWCSMANETIRSSGFRGQLQLVQGDASTTIESFVQARGSSLEISALRVSCNWYEPVLAAMRYLVPKVGPGGTIFLDGFFFWTGFRRAVSESLGTHVEEQGLRLGDCLVLSSRYGGFGSNVKGS